MADIKLGQKIAGSIATTDLKLSDPNSQFNGLNYDEYNVSGLETFRQINFSLDRPLSVTGFAGIRVVNTATGVAIGESVTTDVNEIPQLNGTSFPGINYKVQVFGANPGSYTLSLNDKGKATSIVSPFVASDIGIAKTRVGTVGENGIFSPLASSDARLDGGILFDIALSANNQFYGVGRKGSSGDLLYRIDPSVATLDQVSEVGAIKNPQGGIINDSLNALEFTPDNKLYAIGAQSNKLYQIDVNTSVATSVGSLPAGLVSSGDFVYDAANSRFLATSLDNPASDSLWQIPLANPAAASKINTIGFLGVYGLDFENGQLTGFTAASIANPFGSRIKIDPATAKGTLDRTLGGAGLSGGVSGASTIPGTTTTTPTPTPVPGALGTKNQSLTNRTIDLTSNPNQTLKVDVTTKGDADYNNNIGFYVVQDSSGSIVVGGKTIKPGDPTYAVEAVKSAILRAGKNDRQPNQDIAGGSIYAPVVVAQGSLTDFVSTNPTNGGDGTKIHAYFNYLGANPDKFDHFRLTGPNTFAVEDQFGGGDRDFNDLVVNLNVKTT